LLPVQGVTVVSSKIFFHGPCAPIGDPRTTVRPVFYTGYRQWSCQPFPMTQRFSRTFPSAGMAELVMSVFMNIHSRYPIGHGSSWLGAESAALTLTRVAGYSPLPQGKTTTPNYSLNHARSGSDNWTASTDLSGSRPRHSGPLQSYL